MGTGDVIKAKREELGMTQQEMADRLFVSRQTVSRWESGSRCPDLMTAKKIAVLLGIPVDDLIPESDLSDYVPPKEAPSGLNRMLAGLFLGGLSTWLLVFGAANHSALLGMISIVLQFGAAVLFFAGFFHRPLAQTDNTNAAK